MACVFTKCCIIWSVDAEMCKNIELESMGVGKWKRNRKSGSNRYQGVWDKQHCRAVHNSQDTTHTPINRGMDEEDTVHVDSGMFFSRERERTNAICGDTYGSRDYHTEWSKSERERQIYDFACMWCLKNDTVTLFTEQKDSQT